MYAPGRNDSTNPSTSGTYKQRCRKCCLKTESTVSRNSSDFPSTTWYGLTYLPLFLTHDLWPSRHGVSSVSVFNNFKSRCNFFLRSFSFSSGIFRALNRFTWKHLFSWRAADAKSQRVLQKMQTTLRERAELTNIVRFRCAMVSCRLTTEVQFRKLQMYLYWQSPYGILNPSLVRTASIEVVSKHICIGKLTVESWVWILKPSVVRGQC